MTPAEHYEAAEDLLAQVTALRAQADAQHDDRENRHGRYREADRLERAATVHATLATVPDHVAAQLNLRAGDR